IRAGSDSGTTIPSSHEFSRSGKSRSSPLPGGRGLDVLISIILPLHLVRYTLGGSFCEADSFLFGKRPFADFGGGGEIVGQFLGDLAGGGPFGSALEGGDKAGAFHRIIA